MTDIEILEQSIRTLDNIMVPSIFTKSIAIPIAQVSENLRALYEAIVKKAKENQNGSKPEEVKEENQDMDFEIVDAGSSNTIPEGAEPI